MGCSPLLGRSCIPSARYIILSFLSLLVCAEGYTADIHSNEVNSWNLPEEALLEAQKLLSTFEQDGDSDKSTFLHSPSGIAMVMQKPQSFKETSAKKTSVDEQEKTLKAETTKLVKGLRDKLRKGLKEVVKIQVEVEGQNNNIKELNSSLEVLARERQHEIRQKFENKKRLAEFRKSEETPEQRLEMIKEQNMRLADDLKSLQSDYNNSVHIHEKLKDKIRMAGLSHWLDTRGKEYVSETAVGMLSKSARILTPMARTIANAVAMDASVAGRIEETVSNLPKKSVLGNVLEDVLLLLPIIPILVIGIRLVDKLYHLSMLHLVFYAATVFWSQSLILVNVSGFLKAEALRYFQQYNELFVVCSIFANSILYVLFLIMQILISFTCVSKQEAVQTLLCMIVGYHFFWNVFQPAVVSNPIEIGVGVYIIYSVVFGIVMYEKNRTLHLRPPFREYVDPIIGIVFLWVSDTMEAMRNVFRDNTETFNPHLKKYKEETETPLVEYRSDGDAKKPREESVVEMNVNARHESVFLRKPQYGRWVPGGIRRSLSEKHEESGLMLQTALGLITSDALVCGVTSPSESASFSSCRS